MTTKSKKNCKHCFHPVRVEKLYLANLVHFGKLGGAVWIKECCKCEATRKDV
jgi:hypothetical protein